MRNPKNSWDRIDSVFCGNQDCHECPYESDPKRCSEISGIDYLVTVGPNDHKLMMNLAAGGPVHAKYRRMITVYVDITAPLYWWKEFDTYKVGTVANSCSTMHKIHDKEFTLDDFSCEHLMGNFDHNELEVPKLDFSPLSDKTIVYTPSGIIECAVIPMLNLCREKFLDTDVRIKNIIEAGDVEVSDLIYLKELRKRYWWQLIQLLPTSYNQKRTIMLNYEVLAGIYPMRKNHKLDEWHVFCDWIESLPYSEIIIGEKKVDPDWEGK